MIVEPTFPRSLTLNPRWLLSPWYPADLRLSYNTPMLGIDFFSGREELTHKQIPWKRGQNTQSRISESGVVPDIYPVPVLNRN